MTNWLIRFSVFLKHVSNQWFLSFSNQQHWNLHSECCIWNDRPNKMNRIIRVLGFLSLVMFIGDLCFGKIESRLRVGKGINVFVRYGYLGISMKVISYNDTERWLFKEPTSDVFKVRDCFCFIHLFMCFCSTWMNAINIKNTRSTGVKFKSKHEHRLEANPTISHELLTFSSFIFVHCCGSASSVFSRFW